MKSEGIKLAKGACPYCGGDLCINYKRGQLYKCLRCHKVITPGQLQKLKHKRNMEVYPRPSGKELLHRPENRPYRP